MIVSFLATKAAKKEVLVQKLVAVGIEKEGYGLFLKRKKLVETGVQRRGLEGYLCSNLCIPPPSKHFSSPPPPMSS